MSKKSKPVSRGMLLTFGLMAEVALGTSLMIRLTAAHMSGEVRPPAYPAPGLLIGAIIGVAAATAVAMAPTLRRVRRAVGAVLGALAVGLLALGFAQFGAGDSRASGVGFMILLSAWPTVALCGALLSRKTSQPN